MNTLPQCFLKQRLIAKALKLHLKQQVYSRQDFIDPTKMQDIFPVG
ncbi:MULTISPECIES: hypothetical protein [Acinetobacter]|nr:MULTISPECIES: hypothetical protein [Acinetobacter]ELW87520.1 hypothetical protein ACINWC743_A0679 [Acinetobacter sp. WC-743]MBJ8427961.1 hypothetical protein [Acinetobacter bereziniae]MBJ8477091.1 hypothetical protein [Acinetobacter bereziniae]